MIDHDTRYFKQYEVKMDIFKILNKKSQLYEWGKFEVKKLSIHVWYVSENNCKTDIKSVVEDEQ